MNSLAEKFVSGLARLLPSGKQADDPLANIRAATRWIENLPVGDACKCQQALFAELIRFNETATEFTQNQLAIFTLLDEKSRGLQDALIHQYLRNPRMSRQGESQLWHAIYGLQWEVARGYHTFVLHLAHEAAKNQTGEAIPLITLRAIRAFGQLLKWRAIRYLPVNEKLWRRLHNLYRIAETGGFQQQPQRAYPEESADCSCETAYLHILMLNLANSGTLYPKQLDLIDRWLDRWHEQLRFASHPDAHAHSFSVDLSADQGPRRVRKPNTGKPMRFWSTDTLLTAVQTLHTALQAGSTPAQLGLGENTRTAKSLELLDHLSQQWASLENREQRRAPRTSIKRLVDVVHGLDAIVGQLKVADAPARVSPYGAGLSYKEEDDVQIYGFVTERTRERVSHLHAPAAPDSPDVERWVMHDESECGYGAAIESRDKDWLRVGALIGIQTHETEKWKIGVVRRLSRVDADTRSVGIETLADAPALVVLDDAGTPDASAKKTGSLSKSGLLLTDNDGSHSLILDPAHYLSGKVCRINGIPNLNLIALDKPIEHSEGWIHVVVEAVNG